MIENFVEYKVKGNTKKRKSISVTNRKPIIEASNDNHIIMVDLLDKSYLEFSNIAEAAKFNSTSKSTIYNAVRYGGIKKGYAWFYKKDFNSSTIIPELDYLDTEISSIDIKTKEVNNYNGIVQASIESDTHYSIIYECLKNNNYFNDGRYLWFKTNKMNTIDIEKVIFKYTSSRPLLSKNGPIIRIDPHTEERVEYENIKKAETENYINISQCIVKNQYTAGGYIWVYKKDIENFDLDKYLSMYNSKYKKVVRIDPITKEETIYNSMQDAVKNNKTGIYSCISGRTKMCNGYYWRYYDKK